MCCAIAVAEGRRIGFGDGAVLSSVVCRSLQCQILNLEKERVGVMAYMVITIVIVEMRPGGGARARPRCGYGVAT